MSLRLSILNLNVSPILHWDVMLFILMFILSQSDMLIFVMVIDRQTGLHSGAGGMGKIRLTCAFCARKVKDLQCTMSWS